VEIQSNDGRWHPLQPTLVFDGVVHFQLVTPFNVTGPINVSFVATQGACDACVCVCVCMCVCFCAWAAEARA
jgi:hypothetical protein